MVTRPTSPDNGSIDSLDQNQVVEAILGPDFEKLNDPEYVYRIIEILESSTETFDNPGLDILHAIANIVAKVPSDDEKSREQLRLNNQLKYFVFKALEQGEKQIRKNAGDLEERINKKIAKAKKKADFIILQDRIRQNEGNLPAAELKQKLEDLEKNLEQKIRDEHSGLKVIIEAQSALLLAIKTVPPYLKQYIENEAQIRRTAEEQEKTNQKTIKNQQEATQKAALDAAGVQQAAEEHKRKKEETKKGNLEPEEMVVNKVSEIRTAEDFFLAESKWANVVNSLGLPPENSGEALYWMNKDGNINPAEIDNPSVVSEYWEFMQLKSTKDAMRHEYESDFKNIILDVNGLSDDELTQYVENEAKSFFHGFLRSLASGVRYTGLLMVVLGVNTTAEAITKITEDLLQRAKRQKEAYEKLQPKNKVAKNLNELRTYKDVIALVEKWSNVRTQSGDWPTDENKPVFWRDSEGNVCPDPITDQATLDAFWAYVGLSKHIKPLHDAKVAAIKNINIDYEGKSDAEIEAAIKKPVVEALEGLLKKADQNNGDFGLMMFMLEANDIAEAQKKMTGFVLEDIKKRKEADKLKPRVKAELVAVNVDQKLRRVAEMLADERLDQEIKEHGLKKEWKELLRVDKLAYNAMMRMTREGVREKYVTQFVERLKKDARMRAELMKLDRDEIRTGFWNHMKQFFTAELPEAGALSEEMEGDLERIAERFGIGWQDENPGDYLTEEEGGTLNVQAIEDLHYSLQQELKGLCDGFIEGTINETEFRNKMKSDILPLIQQFQNPTDSTLVAYLESKTGLADGDISKMGLLDKLKKHKEGAIRLDLDNIRLVMGQARNVHVATEVKSMSLWDRTSRVLVEKAQKNRILGKVLSPATIALVGYTAGNAFHLGLTGTLPRITGTAIAGAALGLMVSSSFPAVAVGIGVGCLAGGTYAYFRRNSEMMRLKAQKERRSAIGYDMQADQLGWDEKTAPGDRLERRMESQGTLYSKRRADDLADDIESAPDYDKKLKLIAEAIARIDISNSGVKEGGIGEKLMKKVDLISFAGETKIEGQRLMLHRKIAEGKVALKGLADSSTPPKDWNRELAVAVEQQKKALMDQIAGADDKFKILKKKESLKAAKFSAVLTGIVGGGTFLASIAGGLVDFGFTETIGITNGRVNPEGLEKALHAHGYSTDDIADIKEHLKPDSSTHKISAKNLAHLSDEHNLKVDAVAYGSSPVESTAVIADGASMDKAKLLSELKSVNPKIDPAKVFDQQGHVDSEYLDQFGVKIESITQSVSSGDSSKWGGLAQVENAEYAGEGSNPDSLRFLWDGKPELKNGNYHFSISKMFNESLEHGSLPNTPTDMKVALEVQENGKSIYKFFEVDNLGRIKIPSEYFGDKVGIVPKGSDVLPGLKTDSLVVGYEDGSGVFRTVSRVTGDGSYSVPSDQIVTGGDVVKYKGTVVTETAGDATVMASATTENPLYGALIINGAPSRHLEYGKKKPVTGVPTPQSGRNSSIPPSSTSTPVPTTTPSPVFAPPDSSPNSTGEFLPTLEPDPVQIPPSSVPDQLPVATDTPVAGGTSATVPDEEPGVKTTPLFDALPPQESPDQSSSLLDTAEDIVKIVGGAKRILDIVDDATKPTPEPVATDSVPPTAGMIPPEATTRLLEAHNASSDDNRQVLDEYLHNKGANMNERARYGLLSTVLNIIPEAGRIAKTVINDESVKEIILKIRELSNSVPISEEEAAIIVRALTSAKAVVLSAVNKRDLSGLTPEGLRDIVAAVRVGMRIKGRISKPAATLVDSGAVVTPEEMRMEEAVPESGPITEQQIEKNATGLLENMGVEQTLENKRIVSDFLRTGATSKEFYENRFHLLPQVDKWLRNGSSYLPNWPTGARQARHQALLRKHDEDQSAKILETAGITFNGENQKRQYAIDFHEVSVGVSHFFNKNTASDLSAEQVKIAVDAIWASRALKRGGNGIPTPGPDEPVALEEKKIPEAMSMSAEAMSEAEFEKLHSRFHNKFERENFEKLSPEEQEQVRMLTSNIANNAELFYMEETKPHALEKSRIRLREHHGFIVKGHTEQIRAMTDGLNSTLNVTQKKVLQNNELSSLSPKIQIMAHPTNPKLAVVRCLMLNPVGSSLNDERISSNTYVLTLPKNSPVLALLRSDQSARTLTFALRYAAAQLNEKAIIFADVPLEGRSKFAEEQNIMGIIDLPNLRAIIYSTENGGTRSKINDRQVTSDEQLAGLVRMLGFASGDTPWTPHPPVNPRDLDNSYKAYQQRMQELPSQAQAAPDVLDESDLDEILSLMKIADNESNRRALFFNLKPDKEGSDSSKIRKNLLVEIAGINEKPSVDLSGSSPRAMQNSAMRAKYDSQRFNHKHERMEDILSKTGVIFSGGNERKAVLDLLMNGSSELGQVFGKNSIYDLSNDQVRIAVSMIRFYRELIKRNSKPAESSSGKKPLTIQIKDGKGGFLPPRAPVTAAGPTKVSAPEMTVAAEAEKKPENKESQMEELARLEAKITSKALDIWNQVTTRNELAFRSQMARKLNAAGIEVEVDLVTKFMDLSLPGEERVVAILPLGFSMDKESRAEAAVYYDFVGEGDMIGEIEKVATHLSVGGYREIRKGRIRMEKTPLTPYENKDAIERKKEEVAGYWDEAAKKCAIGGGQIIDQLRDIVPSENWTLREDKANDWISVIDKDFYDYVVPRNWTGTPSPNAKKMFKISGAESGTWNVKKAARLDKRSNRVTKGEIFVEGEPVKAVAEARKSVPEEKEASEAELQAVTDMWNESAKISSNGKELFAQVETLANTKGWTAQNYSVQHIIELTNKKGVRVLVPGRPQGPAHMVLKIWFNERPKSGTGKWKLVRPAVVSKEAGSMAPTDIVGELLKKGEFIPG